MIESTSCCSCGNIKTKGKTVPNCVYPNIPLVEKKHLRYCEALYSIQPQSIEIQNHDDVCYHTLSKSCYSMKCSICGETFFFFFWSGYRYFGKAQQREKNNKLAQNSMIQRKTKLVDHSFDDETHNSFIHQNDKIKAQLPGLFKILISNNKNKQIYQDFEKDTSDQINSYKDSAAFAFMKNCNDEKILSNDIDFELMFSNKNIPYIGSYLHDMSIFNNVPDEKNIYEW